MRDRRAIQHAREKLLSGIGVPKPKPFVPDEFQLRAIESLKQGIDTLVIAPTGSGKTYIAVEGISEVVRSGRRAIYTAPLKALSNSKYTEFKKKFEPEFSVGLLTGDRKIEGDASIVVATTEIYRNELYSSQGNYGLVVLDELHYLADPQRGAVWEESIILSPRSCALLMLSASISNPKEIASWISDVRRKEVQVIEVKERPVELRLGFMHPDFGVIPLADERGNPNHEVSQFYNQPRFAGGPRWVKGGRRGRRRGR